MGGARGAQSWPIFQIFSNFEEKKTGRRAEPRVTESGTNDFKLMWSSSHGDPFQKMTAQKYF